MRKIKFMLEYDLKCTTPSVFRAVSTAEGLREWFADKVDISNDKYTFFWNKVQSVAHVVQSKENAFIKYSWEEDENHFFEFRIINHELTGDITLEITDFVDEDDYDDTVNLWNLQVEKLKRSIGCVKN